jgi:hypothetical protein
MDDAIYFRHLAERCYHLATQCFDLGVAGKLNAKGDAFSEKAHEFDSNTPRRPVTHFPSNN